MKQSTFVTLGLLAFGLILLTFVIRGTTRLILGDRVAALLSAPVGIAAGGLLLGLFVLAILAVTGIKPMDEDLDR